MPLLVDEPVSKSVLREIERDADILVWWSSEVECASALCRLERDGALSAAGVSEALTRLNESPRDLPPLASLIHDSSTYVGSQSARVDRSRSAWVAASPAGLSATPFSCG